MLTVYGAYEMIVTITRQFVHPQIPSGASCQVFGPDIYLSLQSSTYGIMKAPLDWAQGFQAPCYTCIVKELSRGRHRIPGHYVKRYGVLPRDIQAFS